MTLSTLRRLTAYLLLTFCASNSYCLQTILVLGDSLSAGYQLQSGESWVDLLAGKIQEEHLEFEVVNASVSGASTADGVNALPKLLSDYKPSITILALGSNDGLRGTPLLQTQNNLRKMIDAAQESDSKVLLIGFKIPPQYGAAYTNAFSALYPKISKEFDVPMVPFLLAGFEANLSYFQKDKLHPTAAAQEIILNNVWPYLQPMLKK